VFDHITFGNFSYKDYYWIKIILSILLFGLALIRQGRKIYTRVLGYEIIPFYIYHSFWGILSLPYAVSPSAFTVFCSIYQLPIIAYFFYYFTDLTKVSYNQLLTFFVKVGVSFSVVNTLLYFVDIPIWNESFHGWTGRIGRGYPTVDVVTQSYALITLLFFDNLKIGCLQRLFYTILVLLGILLQFSGTGTVLIACITLVCVFSCLFQLPNELRKNLKMLLFSIPLSVFLSYLLLDKYSPELLERSMFVLENRTSVLLGEDPELNTMETRERQYKRNLLYQNTAFRKMFGIGVGRTTFKSDIANNPSYIYIENQYSFNKICYGYFGAVLLIVFIMMFFLKSLLMKHITFSTRIFLCMGVIVFTINSNTVVPLSIFANSAPLALFYAIFMRMRNGKFS
jgi:hypothetical protein